MLCSLGAGQAAWGETLPVTYIAQRKYQRLPGVDPGRKSLGRLYSCGRITHPSTRAYPLIPDRNFQLVVSWGPKP